MRYVSVATLAIVFAIAPAQNLRAQVAQSTSVVPVPRLVNMTGIYQPADGQPPPAGTVVTLLIYADEQGGTPLWQETQNVVLDKSGRYSLLLGAAQADGIPLEVFAAGEARWLALHFAGLGEVEASRTRITSVPYALKSADADTLGGHPASAYVLAPTSATADSHSSTATTSTATGTTQSGKAQSNATTDVVLAGTPNVLAKYVTSADVGNSALFESGGQVGINTTAPADALHVRFTNTNGTMTGLAVQNMGNTATSYSGTLFYDQNNQLAQFQGFNNLTHEYRINNIAPNASINFMTGSVSRFLVANTGNIGIGTSTPSFKLDVAGDINLTGDTRFQGSTAILFRKGSAVPAGNDMGVGVGAMNPNVTGAFNVGIGDFVLGQITSGSANTSIGGDSMVSNTVGSDNTAAGTGALAQNISGNENTAIGSNAMQFNTTGANNIAIGNRAGINVAPVNSNNIDIGTRGVVTDNGVIRIGTGGTQTAFFGVGIRGITTGAADAVAVVIDSNGQLGTINSSRRYKEDIHDMSDASSGLMKLRPVTYRYKQAYADGSKPIDYGLIAEEVEEVYPDLVAHLADGGVETVQYQKINAMLLNEVQKQHAEIAALKARLDALERERR